MLSEQPDLSKSALSPALLKPRVHHVAIESNCLDECVRWYRDFLGCQQTWELSTFSQVTKQRLPGITRLVEIAVGDLRLHVFERLRGTTLEKTTTTGAVQHVCVAVSSSEELMLCREQWFRLQPIYRAAFAADEAPTDVITDADGSQSFYAHDVNGVEFEFRYEPARGT
jgi:catechol 2,3-dioxygenase-like lactoylglutathione lyase family enzyme